MDEASYWSVGECSEVSSGAPAGLYWSVQRCRWEPVGTTADALATPWSMFRVAQPDAGVPQQRSDRQAPVEL